jgi:hypothetical protein
MNIHRKIQVAASIIVANGLLAIGLLSPSSAFATTCNATFTCVTQSTCGIVPALCAAEAPAGCKVAATACLFQQGCPGHYQMECFYTPS